MPDVFISYAREDRERARVLAGALEAQSWSVWWDRKLVAGQTFDQTIEQHLETAGCVVVLWSEHSIGSEWVRNEAAVASERDVLVPALIDNVKQPLEFRRRHAADLTGWTGDLANVEFQGLCEGIAAKIRVPAVHREATAPPMPPLGPRRLWPVAATALAVLLAGLGVYTLWVVAAGDGLSSGNRGTDRLRVVNVPPSEIRGRDNPLPLALGTVNRISLDNDEEYYLQLSEPIDDIKIVLDMRRADGQNSNLLSTVGRARSGWGGCGGSCDRLQRDRRWRAKDGVMVREAAATHRLQAIERRCTGRLLAECGREPAPGFVSFFGSVVPEPLSLDEDKSGLLDQDEDAYYSASLQPGEYRVTVDFVNAERQNTNILGAVALLDADGGNSRRIIRFNEIDVSYRKPATFLVRDAAPIILNVQNDNNETIRYTLKLANAQ